MQIYGVSNLKPSEATRKKRGVKTGDFASVMDSEDENTVTSSSEVTSINSISNILSLQSVDYDAEIKRDNAEHGEKLLDSMDDLMRSSLDGDDISKEKALLKLQKEVKNSPKDLTNDELDELLDSIKLRSAVELAKNKLKG
jgi:hypothetical protein